MKPLLTAIHSFAGFQELLLIVQFCSSYSGDIMQGSFICQLMAIKSPFLPMCQSTKLKMLPCRRLKMDV
jgi:hypothetical protein